MFLNNNIVDRSSGFDLVKIPTNYVVELLSSRKTVRQDGTSRSSYLVEYHHSLDVVEVGNV